jgi:hypothetical protein
MSRSDPVTAAPAVRLKPVIVTTMGFADVDPGGTITGAPVKVANLLFTEAAVMVSEAVPVFVTCSVHVPAEELHDAPTS